MVTLAAVPIVPAAPMLPAPSAFEEVAFTTVAGRWSPFGVSGAWGAVSEREALALLQGAAPPADVDWQREMVVGAAVCVMDFLRSGAWQVRAGEGRVDIAYRYTKSAQPGRAPSCARQALRMPRYEGELRVCALADGEGIAAGKPLCAAPAAQPEPYAKQEVTTPQTMTGSEPLVFGPSCRTDGRLHSLRLQSSREVALYFRCSAEDAPTLPPNEHLVVHPVTTSDHRAVSVSLTADGDRRIITQRTQSFCKGTAPHVRELVLVARVPATARVEMNEVSPPPGPPCLAP